MPERDLVLWSMLITAHAKANNLTQAKKTFDKNIVVSTSILAAYTQSGHPEKAKTIFETMPERNLVSWTSLLAAYSHREKVEYAPKKSSFVEFHACGICPKRTRNQELFEAMPERDLVSWTTMVTSYTQTEHFESAKNVFESMPERNSMAWKAMIAAHARQVEEAKFTFHQMPLQSLVSWNTMIFAYGQSGYCDEAYNAMPERDAGSPTTMFSAYAHNGHIDRAAKLFDLSPLLDIISWRTILAAFAQNGQFPSVGYV
ncbi:pentatricopeptide repeat-containing protein At2g35030, mitochondrial-like [Selaginella moellendorffii]|uniref:pentatricopeptide repeat-containing protein At2g35030, mitochondrial-like n=1 Tax=Selaginella moellendorffii TaxID=88036 RepID=UPI000D1CC3F0|nr:pentatricopeptide repeat-containing protein At2g35030, mitochondrial-like [Selaginella moellendorffii]|eukprot:XP_024525866.1 pentatricopeptide repeat-containing protein At2g35030, mitochondrial-like [Selaginella moellendorffii]